MMSLALRPTFRKLRFQMSADKDDNGLRYSIGNPAKLTLLLKEFFLRSFSIFDVGIAPKPPDDVAFGVELRNDTYEEPSVLTVISPDASLQFTWFASLH